MAVNINMYFMFLLKLGLRCVTAPYTLNSDGASITVNNQSKRGA